MVNSRRLVMAKVVSNKMDKTAVVEVSRTMKHPKYGKYVVRTSRRAIHDPDNLCGIGDSVHIKESKPYSKTKRWVFVEKINA